MYNLLVIGGGAAGFFGAIQYKLRNAESNVLIIEKSNKLLSKVLISGGGRCNVTHACFNPKELILNYPRGSKELLGPFHYFGPGDLFEFFENHGVPLKIESDNRVFPESNSSETIANTFLRLANQLGIQVKTQVGMRSFRVDHNGGFSVTTNAETLKANSVLIACGSSKSVWQVLEQHNIPIVSPVPSLFTFNCKDSRIAQLAGVSVANATVKINKKLQSSGPLLVTHWGLSGPAVLKLSAWGALDLAALNYKFSIIVNWAPEFTVESLTDFWSSAAVESPKKLIKNLRLEAIPKRLLFSFLSHIGVSENQTLQAVKQSQWRALAEQICACEFQISGKSTFKDEFVTAGGVDLKSVDFRTMESKIIPQLYFAGELLNIDAITGGFNFQAAWTTSYIAAQNIAP